MGVEEVVRRFESVKGERGNWEQHWQEIGDYVIPRRGDFVGHGAGLSVGQSGGRKRTEKIFDGTAPWALEQLASGLHGMLTGPAVRWFVLRAQDDALNEVDAVQRWLEVASDRLYALFNGPKGNFSAQAHELYLDLAAFGTAVMLVDDQGPDGALRFQTRHLGECHVAENAHGRVDTLYREFQFTARQAVQFFGERTPAVIASAVEATPQRRFTFLHAVFPRGDMPGNRALGKNKPWASLYLSLEPKEMISEGGFDEFPYLVPRWSKLTGERYGRSPAMTVLPDIKMVNAMTRTVIIGAQKQIDPPLLAPSDGFLNPIRTTPGGINYYDALAQRGPDAIKPLLTGGQPGLGLDLIQAVQQAIVRGFHVDWLTLRDSPQMTATEVLQRRDERLRLLGPVVSRMQAEFQGPLIDRSLKILERQSLPFWAEGLDGPLPLPPEEMREQELEVDYVTPIGQAQKAVQVESMSRVIEGVERLSAFDQSLPGLVDAEAAVREIADIYNAPMDMLRAPEALAAIRQQQAEQAQAEQAASLNAEQAGAARDLAQAGKLAAESRR